MASRLLRVLAVALVLLGGFAAAVWYLWIPNWRPPLRAGESYGTGAYHFFTLCTDGAKQARHFLRVAPPDPAALAPAVDLEFGGNGCALRLSQLRGGVRRAAAVRPPAHGCSPRCRTPSGGTWWPG